jgi:hypothetical protein
MTESRESTSSLGQWALAHPLMAFPLMYLGWAFLFWTPLLFSESSVWAFPNILWFLIGGASPIITGLGLAALTGGKAQLRDIGQRLVDWRRIPALWWLPMIICHTMLIVQIYNRTGRSILAVLIFHGMMNFTGEWLRISQDMYPFMLSGNVLFATLLIVLWQRERTAATNTNPNP